jgi:hypothetical protein
MTSMRSPIHVVMWKSRAWTHVQASRARHTVAVSMCVGRKCASDKRLTTTKITHQTDTDRVMLAVHWMVGGVQVRSRTEQSTQSDT